MIGWIEGSFIRTLFLFFSDCLCDFSLPAPLELSVIKTVLAMIGKFGITASLSIIYVYSAEVFPTVIRYVVPEPEMCLISF